MKIEFENGSTIESIFSTNKNTKGSRLKLILLPDDNEEKSLQDLLKEYYTDKEVQLGLIEGSEESIILASEIEQLINN